MERELLKKGVDERVEYEEKVRKVKMSATIISDFHNFVNEGGNWDDRFDITFDGFVEQIADSNMRIFMGQAQCHDLIHVQLSMHTRSHKSNGEKKGESLSAVAD